MIASLTISGTFALLPLNKILLETSIRLCHDLHICIRGHTWIKTRGEGWQSDMQWSFKGKFRRIVVSNIGIKNK